MASIDTFNVNPYEGIKFIKVSKIDKNGKNITYRLLNLQSLTLSLGSTYKTYQITQRQEFDTYFLFDIDNQNYNTKYTSSFGEEIYKEYDYDFSINRGSVEYNPKDRSSIPTPGQYVNAFGNNSSIGNYVDHPITIYNDSNGPDGEEYFAKYLGITQPQKLFFWSNTPSIPMKYEASIRVTSTKKYTFTVAMIKSNNTAEGGGTGTLTTSVDTDIIPSNVIITNFDTFSNITPSGQEFISGTPLTIDVGEDLVSTKVIQLEGITDVVQGQFTTVVFKFDTTDDDPVWDPEAISIENINFTISPYHEIGNDGTLASFPQEGITSVLATQPDLLIEDVSNVDLYEFSDYNPTLNNALITKKSQYIQKSIRDKNALNPTNLPLILRGLASPSEVNDFNYELNASINSRYKGAKNTSAGFNLNSKKGLGLPPVEQNTNIFLNCLGAGGQTPEVKNSTAFFFNKVIDERLDVYPSAERDIPQFLDIQYAFSPGIKANVSISPKNNNFTAYDGLSGTHNIIGIGKLQTLITTGQGINAFNYVNQLEFEGADVENFQDFWYRKNFSEAETTLGANSGRLRFYKDGPWVKKSTNSGELEGSNDLSAVGEVAFTNTSFKTIPFPDEVISVNSNSSADAGYTWDGEGYTFDFDTSLNTVTPELQFEAKFPIVWLGHPAFKTGGSDNGNGGWDPSDDGTEVFAENVGVFSPLSLSFKLEVRVRLIKGSGDEENISILKFPISDTEYTEEEGDNVLSLDRGVFGHQGLQFIENASIVGWGDNNDYSPTETPICVKTQPRTFENGDKIKIQARFVEFNDTNNLVSNSSKAQDLIKLIKVKNLEIKYDSDDDTDGLRPAIFNTSGDIVESVGVRELNFENSYYFRTLYQDPQPSDIVPINSTSGRWASLVKFLGNTTHLIQNNLDIVCLSSELTSMAAVKDTQILSGSQESFSSGDGGTTGYSKELLTAFDPQPGDQIRFGYNEEYTRTIIKVHYPQDTNTNRIYFSLNQPLPALDEEVNHFIIRRFNKDNTQITMDVKKLPTPPNSPSGETELSTITPVFLSEGLKTDFSKIIRNLTDEGIL